MSLLMCRKPLNSWFDDCIYDSFIPSFQPLLTASPFRDLGQFNEEPVLMKHHLDIGDYRPNEITLKVDKENNQIVVVGKKERTMGGERLTSQFEKKYDIPADVDVNSIKHTIERGILTIAAKKIKKEGNIAGRIIKEPKNEDETRGKLVIQVGEFTPEQLNVHCNGRYLIIKGERNIEQQSEGGQSKRSYVSCFSETIDLKSKNLNYKEVELSFDQNNKCLIVEAPLLNSNCNKVKVLPIKSIN